MTDDKLNDDEWRKVQQDLRKHIGTFRSVYGDNGSRNQEIRKETDDVVIFADSSGQELSEIADINNVDQRELSARMHAEAKQQYDGNDVGDAWSVADPIVVYKA